MRDWRVASNDASYAALDVHDLRVEAEEGSFAPAGALAGAARRIPDADAIVAASERLIVPTQIDASKAAGSTVITPGRLIGVATAPQRTVEGVEVTGPPVDSIAVESGRGLPAGADARPVAVLDPQYADENGIELPARIRVAGGGTIEVVGLGRSPETFVVTGPGGSFSGSADFGPLFVSLNTAQRLARRPGEVNDLAVALRPGADPAAIAGQLEREISRRLPGFGMSVTGTDEIDGRRVLYDDADNDQQLFNVFAFLILAGAGFGAFNLISRTIEAQRREIGIGMALGVERSRLAIRPLLMGLQIAVAGVVFGILVGLAVNAWLRGLLTDQLPLPFLDTDLRPGKFAGRAAIGFAIPLLAAAWPVWRGLRVAPIEAIRVGFRASRGGGMAPLLARIALPGGSLAQIPPRNVLRAPRRTLLTVLASAAVISVAVSMSGMLDSFETTVDRNSAEELRIAPNRLTITLDRFRAAGDGELRALTGTPIAAATDTKLTIPSSLRSDSGESIDVVVETIPAVDPLWTPRVSAGSSPEGPAAVLIAESAADDLGVGPGDRITLIHPRRSGRRPVPAHRDHRDRQRHPSRPVPLPGLHERRRGGDVRPRRRCQRRRHPAPTRHRSRRGEAAPDRCPRRRIDRVAVDARQGPRRGARRVRGDHQSRRRDRGRARPPDRLQLDGDQRRRASPRVRDDVRLRATGADRCPAGGSREPDHRGAGDRGRGGARGRDPRLGHQRQPRGGAARARHRRLAVGRHRAAGGDRRRRSDGAGAAVDDPPPAPHGRPLDPARRRVTATTARRRPGSSQTDSIDTGFSSQDAQSDFNRARRRAALARLSSRLRGQAGDVTTLLPFEEVVEALGRTGERRIGLKSIPLETIVGSVDRAGEFDRDFRPRSARVRARWQRINDAQRRGKGMPPIEVLRVGGLHFVVDGHHRVSVARHLGREVIEAYVTEITTRVAPQQGLKLADLPAKSHERLFLERVPLTVEQRRRIAFSDPASGYAQLGEAVEAWGFRLMHGIGELLDRGEVAESWFEDEYGPVVESIRDADLVGDGTDADAYVRVVRDRYMLLRTHDWDEDVIARLRTALG